MEATFEGNRVDVLAELGRPAEALEHAGRLLAAAEASGDMFTVSDVRTVALAIRLARGERESPADVERLVELARTSADRGSGGSLLRFVVERRLACRDRRGVDDRRRRFAVDEEAIEQGTELVDRA
jgi:hypothetical protein